MKTETGKELSPDDIVCVLKATTGPETRAPESAAFVIQAAKMLASGEPVSTGAVSEALAMDGQTSRATINFLRASDQLGFTRTGLIDAVAGLTLAPTNYRFIIGTQTLYTWCAIDSLFFPRVLEMSASVQSQCPVSGHIINIIVDPSAGIVFREPSSAAVSIVIPAAGSAAAPTVKQKYRNRQTVNSIDSECAGALSPDGLSPRKTLGAEGAFCSNVYFFKSSAEASIWRSDREDIAILSLGQAHEIAIRAWADPLRKQTARFYRDHERP